MPKSTATALKAKLDQQLVELQKDSEKTLLVVRTAVAEEHAHYVNAYLWWFAASGLEGYLSDLYKKRGIATRKVKKGINFRPMLSLLSDGQITDNDLTYWTKALNKVHAEFESNVSHYKTDTHKRLCHFIASSGGKTGLADYHSKNTDFDEVQDDATDAQEIKALLFELDEAEFEPTLISEAKNFYGHTTSGVSIPSVQTTAEGFSVVLVKQDGNKSHLIGSCDNTNIVNKIIASTYRNDFSAMQATMRCVLEPLHILNVPLVATSDIDKYIEYSAVNDVSLKGKKHRAYKRLIYRKESQDFLLSNTWVKASPVLIAKPKHNLFGDLEGDIGITNEVKRSIEVRLLHQLMFNLFRAEADYQYIPAPAGFLSKYKLALNTKLRITDESGVTAAQVISATENLRHPDITWRGFYGGNDGWQVDLKNKAKNRCVWTGNWDINGLRTASNLFFKQWVGAYSKIANRPMHKLLKLKLDSAGMRIEFELNKRGVGQFSQVELSNCKGDVELSVRSTDFAFLLRQLADLSVNGAIEVFANTHGLILHFETDANEYQCAIPSCNAKYVRDDELFAQYAPTISKLKISPVERDEYDVEYRDEGEEEAEREALLKAVKRLKK